jgi:hypothetical protein
MEPDPGDRRHMEIMPMNNPFVPGVGAVFSADIDVPEHAREVRFYSRVRGAGDAPL